LDRGQSLKNDGDSSKQEKILAFAQSKNFASTFDHASESFDCTSGASQTRSDFSAVSAY